MIIDGALQFTGVAGIAGSPDSPTASGNSNNVIDLLNARDMGIGDDPALKILLEVTATFSGLTSLQPSVQLSPDNSSWTTVVTGAVYTAAQLLQGTHLLDIDLPRILGAFSDRPGAAMPLPRYIRLGYAVVGVGTGGSLFGALVLDRQDQISYPPGIVIAN